MGEPDLPESKKLAAEKTQTAEKGVYSRGLMLKVLEAQTEPMRHTPSTDSTESGRSSPDVQEEEEGDDTAKQAKERAGKARASSLDAACLPERAQAETGLQLRPRAWSEGTSMEEVSSAAATAPTTVMLRNIPNQYSREKLCKRLDSQGFAGQYDFLYLPIDRNSERNMGYAFINFRTQQACTEFARCFSGKLASECLPGYKSNKVCEVRVAQVQGQQANLEKMTSPNFFQHLADHEEWQPIFFDENGDQMPLAARETTEATGSGRRSRQSSRTTPSPEMLPFMPPIMVPYTFTGLPMPAVPSPRTGTGAELCAEAPEFIPSTSSSCLGPAMPAPVDTATVMAMKHLEAEAAARAAAVAQARANAIRPNDMKKQIEYYFSAQNMSHDVYLRKMMDESGWVNLEDIVKFPKLRSLSADATSAARALAGSESVELSQDARRVRMGSEDLRGAYPPLPEAGLDDAAAEDVGGEDVATAAGGA